jgi:hypothetical protein
MKICLIIRGPIRPNKEVVLNNIKLISSSFFDYNYDMVFATWNNNMDEVSYIIDSINPKYSIISSLPKINYTFKDHSFNPKNCFNQFYLANKAIDFALSLNNYDFFVLMRTDLKMSVDLKKWIKKDSYVTIHSKQCGQPFTNDQFGIAPPNIMKNVWNYNDELSLYNLIDSSQYPEQIIDLNIESSGVSVLQEPPILWEIMR